MTKKVNIGTHSIYRALEWSDGFDVNLGDVIRMHPELVLGNQVVIVRSDSVPYQPNSIELASGWQKIDELAISPSVTDISFLPTPCFDEWYIFERAPDPAKLFFLSSMGSFQLFGEGADAEAFWSQVEELKPLHVLVGAVDLLLVTRDDVVFRRMLESYKVT